MSGILTHFCCLINVILPSLENVAIPAQIMVSCVIGLAHYNWFDVAPQSLLVGCGRPGGAKGILNATYQGGSWHADNQEKEKCASALNNYLGYRHESNSADTYKVQKLENQVGSLCEGYQIKLVDNNGVMTGVIELAE